MEFNSDELEKTLFLLNGRLLLNNAHCFYLIVCGGSALLINNLIQRVTKDVDVVALCDENLRLIDPEPLPEELVKAAKEVAEDLNLPENWLNNGPSSGEGGIFRLGLPDNIISRCIRKKYGEKLTVFFTGRLDLIFFKLYAAVDRFGGYHADDLVQLEPADEELIQAARWSMTHDPSEGYRQSMEILLREIGYEHIIKRI